MENVGNGIDSNSNVNKLQHFTIMKCNRYIPPGKIVIGLKERSLKQDLSIFATLIIVS